MFDTGLHRHLTLTHHDGYASTMQWGQPQEETVRDYDIEIRIGREWNAVKEVRDNYQRLNRHSLDSGILLNALRVTVLKTNGINHARIAAIQMG